MKPFPGAKSFPLEIRGFAAADYDAWLPLWQANCLHCMDDAVTRQTWARLCDPRGPVNGLGIWKDGHLAGILHYILHPVTGSLAPACYMQDLFVDPGFRRQGLARCLLWDLQAIGRDQGWARIYWLAQKDNEAAQNLYKTLGIALDFTLHILPTQEV